MTNHLSNFELYKTFIGKDVLINGKKHKVNNIRKSGEMVLLYYDYIGMLKGKPGVANIEVAKNIKTKKSLSDKPEEICEEKNQDKK